MISGMKQGQLMRLTACQALLAAVSVMPTLADGDPTTRIQRSPATVPAGAMQTQSAPKTGVAAKAVSPTAAQTTNSTKAPIRVGTISKTSPLEHGKEFSRHGAYNDAFNFFNKAANLDPKNPEPYNRRARVEWQLEKNKEALEDANYAISLNPDYAEAFCTRAAILNSMGKYHEAIADTSLAQELKPKLREAYTLQASAYRNLKQYREADEATEKAQKIPDAVSAFDEFAPKIDYTAYVNDLQMRVKSHWQAPQGTYPAIVVLFKLHRDGNVSDVRVNTAAVATADNAAIEAVKSSAPFSQPPAGSPPDFDCFVVLDPPVGGNMDVPVAQAPADPHQSQQAPPAAPKAGINWGGALNTGLNLMRFLPTPHW